jgi:hypothetical protein
MAAVALPLWPVPASAAEPDRQFVSQTHPVNVYGHACQVVVQLQRNGATANASTGILGDEVCRTPDFILVSLSYISAESGKFESVTSSASGPTIEISTLRATRIQVTEHIVEWDPVHQGPTFFVQVRPK